MKQDNEFNYSLKLIFLIKNVNVKWLSNEMRRIQITIRHIVAYFIISCFLDDHISIEQKYININELVFQI